MTHVWFLLFPIVCSGCKIDFQAASQAVDVTATETVRPSYRRNSTFDSLEERLKIEARNAVQSILYIGDIYGIMEKQMETSIL